MASKDELQLYANQNCVQMTIVWRITIIPNRAIGAEIGVVRGVSPPLVFPSLVKNLLPGGYTLPDQGDS